MLIEDLDLDELEELLDAKVIALNDLKNSLEHLSTAINDIADVEYDGVGSVYNDLLDIRGDLEELKKSLETDIDEIADQMATLEEWQDDDPNERYREYRDMQGF